MYDFNVKGDIGRYILSISGASAECGISTSTINREVEKENLHILWKKISPISSTYIEK